MSGLNIQKKKCFDVPTCATQCKTDLEIDGNKYMVGSDYITDDDNFYILYDLFDKYNLLNKKRLYNYKFNDFDKIYDAIIDNQLTTIEIETLFSTKNTDNILDYAKNNKKIIIHQLFDMYKLFNNFKQQKDKYENCLNKEINIWFNYNRPINNMNGNYRDGLPGWGGFPKRHKTKRHKTKRHKTKRHK